MSDWLADHVEDRTRVLGLNGVILLAYIVAIPANEIVIPTVLMLTGWTTGAAGCGEAGAIARPLLRNEL